MSVCLKLDITVFKGAGKKHDQLIIMYLKEVDFWDQK